jgi:hypothetical protein
LRLCGGRKIFRYKHLLSADLNGPAAAVQNDSGAVGLTDVRLTRACPCEQIWIDVYMSQMNGY